MSDYQNAMRLHQAADDAWQAELVRLYGRQAGDARYDARGRSTDTLARLAADKVAAGEAQHRAFRDLVNARVMAGRPDIGILIRNGRQVFYTFASGNYAESDAAECLPVPRLESAR
jgi:hypothetical protein